MRRNSNTSAALFFSRKKAHNPKKQKGKSLGANCEIMELILFFPVFQKS